MRHAIENGLAIWTHRIGEQEIASRWLDEDGEFKPAKHED